MAAAAGIGLNLGPVSNGWLQAQGISSLQDLRRVGAVAAYLRVKRDVPHASLNLLWALAGALENCRWNQLSSETRTRLLLELAAAQRSVHEQK